MKVCIPHQTRTVLACLTGVVTLFVPAICNAQTNRNFTISTIAGSASAGSAGNGGPATSAQLNLPVSAVFVGGLLYIADEVNDRVQLVQTNQTITTVAGVAGTAGYTGDKGAATKAELSSPTGVAVDGSGNLYISDTVNQVVRKVTTAGTITTYAGNNADGPGFSGDTGQAVDAQLFNPAGVAVDSAGNLYIADSFNNLIRKVTSAGVITSIAGNGIGDYFGDGLLATKAEINHPQAIAVDSAGNLYIADTQNNRIRKVSASTGIITTFAGNGTTGKGGDGGPPTSAQLNHPEGVAVDANGNIYIADTFNNKIRLVAAGGPIETIAGNGISSYFGDGGPATSAELKFPSSVALDTSGNVYIADSQNDVIRLLTPVTTGAAPSINANGVISATSFGAFSAAAPGSWIEIYGSNLAADSRIWTGSDFSGVNAPTSLDGTIVTIGGQPAVLSYISPAQVNAQVPINAGTGPQILTATSANGTSAVYTLTVNPTEPGLFAPASFNIGGTQYVTALFSDGVTYVLPTGAIAGITSRPAKPGDAITLYGVGFGAVTPATPQGQVVEQVNKLNTTPQILFGQTSVTLTYAGLAPFAIGLYQFNLTVPNVAASNAVPVTFSVGGTVGTQTLSIAIQSATP